MEELKTNESLYWETKLSISSFGRRERTTHGSIKPVTDDTLRQLYDVMKWAPTSANGRPGPICLSSLAGGERETTTDACAGERGEDNDRTGDSDHCV